MPAALRTAKYSNLSDYTAIRRQVAGPVAPQPRLVERARARVEGRLANQGANPSTAGATAELSNAAMLEMHARKRTGVLFWSASC